MQDLFPLVGRVAPVTGGARGNVRMIASALLRRGAHVDANPCTPAPGEASLRASTAGDCTVGDTPVVDGGVTPARGS